MEQQGDVQQALLNQAQRQTKALEGIHNLMWFFLALSLLGAVLWVGSTF